MIFSSLILIINSSSGSRACCQHFLVRYWHWLISGILSVNSSSSKISQRFYFRICPSFNLFGSSALHARGREHVFSAFTTCDKWKREDTGNEWEKPIVVPEMLCWLFCLSDFFFFYSFHLYGVWNFCRLWMVLPITVSWIKKSGVALAQLSLTLHNSRRIFYYQHYIHI